MEPKMAFLKAHGVAIAGHGVGTLLEHLQEVRALLVGYGARGAVCDAGLFHSVYGTESYQAQTIPDDLRPQVAGLIGEEAERLARLFGVMNKASFYALLVDGEGRMAHRQTGDEIALSRADVCDLCDMVVANWLEQRPRAPEKYQRIREEAFRQMLPLLIPGSRTALKVAYGFD
jgi:hypothetical protein